MKRSLDSSDELEKKPHLEEETEQMVEQEHEISEELGNIVAVHMDITEPLSSLKTLLEQRLQCMLTDHIFYLQDSQVLDPSKNLVEQCVQGEGTVQINVEIISKPDAKPKINIVDVLKPADELLHIQESETQEVTLEQPPIVQQVIPKLVIPIHEESENVTRWTICQNFRRDQDRLKIPIDPILWEVNHVKHWIIWAMKEFNLEGVDINNFNINGKQLCSLTHEEFAKKIPYDKGDLFWTHLELLRKCKFVAIVQQPTPNAITTVTVSTTPDGKVKNPTLAKSSRPRSPRITGECNSPGNRTGNNGQIQLWQFLLELLTDKDSRECIQWLGDEGEFKLNNPEMVAQLWGQRKNKPTMNYEKLSRALRYYYDGDMIAKVHGKRFVYKFVCDLKGLLGYSAGELNRLVSECEQKKIDKVRSNFLTGKKVEINTTKTV